MSAAGFVLTLLVAVWLLLTLPAQYRDWGTRIARFDPLRLIPRWTFFAPNPAIHDHNLIVRSRDARGKETSWRSVRVCPPRSAIDVVWNPHKRVRKVVIDLIQSLSMLRRRPGIGDYGCPTTMPYLLLFHYCARQCEIVEGREFEFAIVRTSGRSNRRLWMVYSSGFHAL
jgi:hypothetical protein